MNPKLYDLLKQYEGAKSFTYAGAGEVDIEKAEEVLGVRIPEEYRAFLTTFGHGGFEGIEILGFGVNKVPIFVETTLDNRKNGMPEQVIAVEDCGEWIYCIHSETGEIVTWFQYLEGLKTAYRSFDEFLMDRVNDVLENME